MKKEIITFYSPKSKISEIFRTLRTNIQFMNNNQKIKTLLITSTMPEEGKSWVSSNLAVVFAQTGKKVLLIDTDMRRGRQGNIFNQDTYEGLSNYLSEIDGEQDIHKYIYETEVENLNIITAGLTPPNPSELLCSDKMKKMLEKLKEEYDLIILDGTPSSIVTDSVIISKYADSTIIVTAYKKTKREDVKRLKQEIENVGGKVMGCILNKTKNKNKKYENGYYYQ